MVRRSQYYSMSLENRISPRKLSNAPSDTQTNVEEEYYTSSDTSPIFSYRRERHKRPIQDGHLYEYDREERNMSVSALVKFFLFCIAMIVFFFLMYIPVYTRVNRMPTAIVPGWSMKSNRDTKLYVQPNNITTRHRPLHVCANNKKLYLLIVVTSAVDNFESRSKIRETWGNYENYVKMSKLHKEIKEKYKNYNFTYDLYNFPQYEVKNQKKYNKTLRVRRGISYGSLLPNLAQALKDNIKNAKTDEVPDDDNNDEDEERFEGEDTTTSDDEQFEASDGLIQQFHMNEVLDEIDEDYDYRESNVMKIAPNGYQDVPDFSRILSLLRNKNPFAISKDISKDVSQDNNYIEEEINYDNFYIQGEKAFKLIFLLGLPADNGTQNKIDEESNMYGDILQEDFLDTYNNLTLKSIMMLKWVVKNCKDSVRYILKTDDDMFVYLPNLMGILKDRSRSFERRHKTGYKENVLLGFLITNAKPILDRNSKWYSPSYMYNGKVYPKYLSGTGYLLTLPTAEALYEAALRVQYFHLEDVYITGLCAMAAHPRIYPSGEQNFMYDARHYPKESCQAYTHVHSHHMKRAAFSPLVSEFTVAKSVDRCERYRLTNLRHYRIRSKKRKKEMAGNRGPVYRQAYMKT